MDFTVPRTTVTAHTCNWDLYFSPSNICLCIKWLCLWRVVLAPVPCVFLLRQKEQTNLGICHNPTFLTSEKVRAARCQQLPLSLSLFPSRLDPRRWFISRPDLWTTWDIRGSRLAMVGVDFGRQDICRDIFRARFQPFLELNLWYSLTPTQTFMVNVYADLGHGHLCTVAASNPFNNSCWSHTATSAVWIHSFKFFWQSSSAGLLVGKCVLLLYFKVNY